MLRQAIVSVLALDELDVNQGSFIGIIVSPEVSVFIINTQKLLLVVAYEFFLGPDNREKFLILSVN